MSETTDLVGPARRTPPARPRHLPLLGRRAAPAAAATACPGCCCPSCSAWPATGHLRHRPDAQGRPRRRHLRPSGGRRPRPRRPRQRQPHRGAAARRGPRPPPRRAARGPGQRRRQRRPADRAATDGAPDAARPHPPRRQPAGRLAVRRARDRRRAETAAAPTGSADRRAPADAHRRRRADRRRRPHRTRPRPTATDRSATATAATAPPAATAATARATRDGGSDRDRATATAAATATATGDGGSDRTANRDGGRRPQRPRRPRTAPTATATATAATAAGPQRPQRPRRPAGQPQRRPQRPTTATTPRNDEDDDDFEGGRGRRGRRYRDRNRRGGSAGGGRERFDQGEPTVSEDDVLLPVAGILDVLDNYAFVRTSGYLTGPNDVYVSLSQVRQLRPAPRRRRHRRRPPAARRRAATDKYNALVRLDTVNGLDPEQARNRPEFTKLTPLYPQERLRLETEPHILTTRVIDLVMPIGKGQRALIVSPAEGRQDDGAAGDRQRDHHEQPRVPPHGRARRRAARRGHRHAAVGEGRGHRLDLRPAAVGPHHGRRAVHRAGQAPGRDGPRRRRAARLDHPAGPRLQPGGARQRAASCPVVSTPRRSTRPSASSARPATSRTAAR